MSSVRMLDQIRLGPSTPLPQTSSVDGSPHVRGEDGGHEKIRSHALSDKVNMLMLDNVTVKSFGPVVPDKSVVGGHAHSQMAPKFKWQ